jgi:hypothetical protein
MATGNAGCGGGAVQAAGTDEQTALLERLPRHSRTYPNNASRT